MKWLNTHIRMSAYTWPICFRMNRVLRFFTGCWSISRFSNFDNLVYSKLSPETGFRLEPQLPSSIDFQLTQINELNPKQTGRKSQLSTRTLRSGNFGKKSREPVGRSATIFTLCLRFLKSISVRIRSLHENKKWIQKVCCYFWTDFSTFKFTPLLLGNLNSLESSPALGPLVRGRFAQTARNVHRKSELDWLAERIRDRPVFQLDA